MRITMKDIEGSFVQRIDFQGDIDTVGDLRITFDTGKTYEYRVWGHVMTALMECESVTEWFDHKVRATAMGHLVSA